MLVVFYFITQKVKYRHKNMANFYCRIDILILGFCILSTHKMISKSKGTVIINTKLVFKHRFHLFSSKIVSPSEACATSFDCQCKRSTLQLSWVQSHRTAESEGRQMKQCRIKFVKRSNRLYTL